MPQMNFQQRILLITAVLLLLLTQHTTNVFAGEATLSWDANGETDLAGYNVHFGTSSQNYGPPIDVGNVTSHTLTGLTNGVTYYFALTAYDTSSNESGFSTEVSKNIPGGDTTAPLLSAIEATNITETGIDITWSSDEASNSLVEYGITTSYGSTSTLGTTLVTNHLRALSNLNPNTIYQYRVVSSDAAGNTATSGNFSFLTTSAPDTTPPVLSNISAGTIGQNSATVTWNTDESATSLVEYGTTASYGSSSVLGSTLVTSHSRILSSLSPGTTYHYRVISSDAESNAANSGNFTFTTDPAPDTTPPVLSNISAGTIGQNNATVTWNTDESATSLVEYGTTASYGSSSVLGSTLVTSHSRILSSLSPDTTYHYRVISTDAEDNAANSGNFTFTTDPAPDTTPPVLSNVSAGNIGQTDATLTWNTDEAATSLVEYGTTASYGSSSSQNNTLSTSHSRTLSSLSPDTTYHYRVISTDAEGNTAASGNFTFTSTAAPDIVPPVISNAEASNTNPTETVITWLTDEAASSLVEYGTTTSYGSASVLNSTPLTSHSRTLSNLNPDTTYHYRVISEDAAGNTAVSGNFSFATTSVPDTVPPQLSNISANNLRDTAANIVWNTDEAATSLVEYGTTTGYGDTSELGNTLVTTHNRLLSNLSPDTTYHYRVISQDAAGNTRTSENFSFTTALAPDTTPPLLSAVSADNITDTLAIITWRSNESASSRVEYGPDPSYGSSTPLSSTLVTEHQLILSNLSPTADYYYRVISEDAAGNATTSDGFTFTTGDAPDTTSPLLSGVSADNITDTLAIITWRSDESASSRVEYGPDPSYGSSTPLSSTLVTEHQLILSNLSPTADYHYRVISEDAAGNATTSDDFTFTTGDTPDTTPPNLLNINANNLTTTTARITWNTNESATGQVKFGETSAYGQSTLPNQSLSFMHEVILDGLTPETLYHYRVESMDAVGNLRRSSNQNFTTPSLPSDTTPNEDLSNESAGGGGCGIVLPRGGNPPGPGDAAGMLTMMGIMMLILLKKTLKTAMTSSVAK